MAVQKINSGSPRAFLSDRDPTVNDDTTTGARIDTRWINTAATPHRKYICTDPTAGAAVWAEAPLAVQAAPDGSLYLTNAAMVVDRYANDASSQGYYGRKSRNATVGGQTILQALDLITGLAGMGSDGSTFKFAATVLLFVGTGPQAGSIPGEIWLNTTKAGDAEPTNWLLIDASGKIGINARSLGNRLVVVDNNNTFSTGFFEHTGASGTAMVLSSNDSGSFAGCLLQIVAARAAADVYSFARFRTTSGPETLFEFRGNGQAFQDGGTTWSSPADAAEFKETLDGEDIPVGTTVVFEKGKVRPSRPDDDPRRVRGVIRPKDGSGSIVMNAANLRWAGKFERDELLRYLTDEVPMIAWQETRQPDPIIANDKRGEPLVTRPPAEVVNHAYKVGEVPPDVVVPPDAREVLHKVRRLNPAFDPARPYVPREQRAEWVLVGALGEAPVLKGQITGDRWEHMRELSPTTDLWYICG